MAVTRKLQPLGEILKEKRILTAMQLEEVLRIGKRTNTRVGKVIVNLGYATEEDIANALAEQYNMPAIMLSNAILEPNIVRLIPEALARRNMVIPVSLEGDTLRVAMTDPLNVFAIDELKKVTRYNIHARNHGDRGYEGHRQLLHHGRLVRGGGDGCADYRRRAS